MKATILRSVFGTVLIMIVFCFVSVVCFAQSEVTEGVLDGNPHPSSIQCVMKKITLSKAVWNDLLTQNKINKAPLIGLITSSVSANVLAMPTITTSDRTSATIKMGESIPYLAGTPATGHFIFTGAKIILTPTLDPNGRIKVSIAISETELNNPNYDRSQEPATSSDSLAVESTCEPGQPVLLNDKPVDVNGSESFWILTANVQPQK